ncbi:unnamed protein product, partial [Didymodactylos carnosus]
INSIQSADLMTQSHSQYLNDDDKNRTQTAYH